MNPRIKDYFDKIRKKIFSIPTKKISRRQLLILLGGGFASLPLIAIVQNCVKANINLKSDNMSLLSTKSLGEITGWTNSTGSTVQWQSSNNQKVSWSN